MNLMFNSCLISGFIDYKKIKSRGFPYNLIIENS